jgi:hypothetical protein
MITTDKDISGNLKSIGKFPNPIPQGMNEYSELY